MTEFILHYQQDNFRLDHKIDIVPPGDSQSHTHTGIEILYFVSGDCYYIVEGTKYRLKAGDIMIMKPSESHNIVFCSYKVPYERIVVSLNSKLIKSIDPDGTMLKHLMNRPLGTLNRFDSALFSHSLCADSFAMIAANGQDMNNLDILSRIMLTLAEADRAIKRLRPEVKKDHIGNRLVDYVNQNLYRNISLQQISDVFFLSKSQINRIFKKHTGSSIGQYVSSKRLLAARNRIRAGEPAVKVSEECGYRDYSSFYRSYCAKFGCCPQNDKN